MPDVTGLADDVFAKGDSEIIHDIAILSQPERAQNNNLKFNPDRIHFKTRECKCFGWHVTPDSMSVDPKKVYAIRLMDATQCRKECENFQGMVNYLKQ